MELIGRGFLARHLRSISASHPGVTVLAAGVPRHPLPEAEHDRERALVRQVAGRCEQEGRLFVFFSTVSLYGGQGCRGVEDEPVEPQLRYGRHKLDMETVVRDSGADHLILRLAYVLGPGGPDFRLVPVLVDQIRSGRVRIQRGARRDLLYVDDFVAVLDRLLDTKVTNEIVNLASGDCARISRVVDHLERRLGITAERDVVEDSVSHCPSVAKLRTLVPGVADLGFGPGYHRTALDRYLDATYHEKERIS